jgi:hypothetical protein
MVMAREFIRVIGIIFGILEWLQDNMNMRKEMVFERAGCAHVEDRPASRAG